MINGPSEMREPPERTCKLCGGFLMMMWCQNPSCERYKDKFRASRKARRCELCDERLALESIRANPCPECLKNEPATILKRFEQSDKDALKAELGYSSEVEWRTFTEGARLLVGAEWRHYTLSE